MYRLYPRDLQIAHWPATEVSSSRNSGSTESTPQEELAVFARSGGWGGNLVVGGGHHRRHNSSSSAALSEDGESSDPGLYKTRLCVRFSSPEGCRYGDQCRFAHGKSDLRQAGGKISTDFLPSPPLLSLPVQLGTSSNSTDSRSSTGEYSRQSSSVSLDAFSSTPTTAKKMSIGAAFAGAIIGKAGANVKEINRVTGAKVSIRDHATDPNLRNVEMEGSVEQIEQASEMVRQSMQNKELLSSKTSALGLRTFKTKMCKNFIQGTCTFADRCHFAHGAYELRQSETGR